MNDTVSRRVLALFVVVAVVFALVAWAAVRNLNREAATNDWVNHTHAVILETGAILAGFQAGDAALRMYALTGSAHEEAACRRASASIADRVELAGAVTRNEPTLAVPMRRLTELAAKYEKVTLAVLTARKAGAEQTVQSLLATDAVDVVEEVRRLVERLKGDQMALLATRDRAAYLQAQTTRWTVWTGLALNFALLGFTGWLVLDDIAARRRATDVLRDANAQLDTRVRERTAELVAVNDRLAVENLERRWGSYALEHQLRYNDLIVNSLNDLVFVLTKALNISRINPAVRNLTRWESVDLINRPFSYVARLNTDLGSGAVDARDAIAQSLKDNRDLRDISAIIADRQKREWTGRLSVFPLRDADKVVGGVAVFRLDTPPA